MSLICIHLCLRPIPLIVLVNIRNCKCSGAYWHHSTTKPLLGDKTNINTANLLKVLYTIALFMLVRSNLPCQWFFLTWLKSSPEHGWWFHGSGIWYNICWNRIVQKTILEEYGCDSINYLHAIILSQVINKSTKFLQICPNLKNRPLALKIVVYTKKFPPSYIYIMHHV